MFSSGLSFRGSDTALCAVTSDLGNGATNSSLGPVDLFLCLESVSGRTSAWNLLFLGMPLLSCSHGRRGSGAKLRFFFFLQLLCFPNLPFLNSFRLLFGIFFLWHEIPESCPNWTFGDGCQDKLLLPSKHGDIIH